MSTKRGAVPRPLEETVVYRVYPVVSSELTDLNQLAINCTSLLYERISDHIWHYEGFQIEPFTTSLDGAPPHLMGRTCYRGNVDDEWFIVKLLFALTEQVNDIIVSISDEDGQFLLIEAAHFLPKWLRPETAENRVFIYQGKLHIIPQPQTPGEMAVFPVATPTLSRSLSIVSNVSLSTIASPSIQQSLQSRLSNCSPPIHCAHCYLPLPAAHLLSVNKQLVSAAVHSLIDRDTQDMKAAKGLAHFSSYQQYPLILIAVEFPRLLYAMLVHDRFTPPTQRGVAATTAAHLLGAKLTYGLEILVTCYGGRGGVDGGHPHSKWEEFVARLTHSGYFEGELEGSCRYQELMRSARQYFQTIDPEEESSVLSRASREMARRLSEEAWSEEEFRKKVLRPADDDSWLNVTPEQLDMYLQHKSNTGKGATPLHLEDMAFGINSFVDQVSSVDGVEFPWSADEVGGVKIDPDEFVGTLERMLDKLETTGGGADDETDSLLSDGDESEGDESEGEESEREEIAELMKQMDRELSQTTLSQSFQSANDIKKEMTQEESADTAPQQQQPLDVDFNLVQNLLQSYSEQIGEATPTATILNTLGITLPDELRK